MTIPPTENSETKSFEVMASMLKRWWIERTADNPLSQQKCTIYSNADRQSIWEGFSADQQFNNAGDTSLESYRKKLDVFSTEKSLRYRLLASEAIELIFPNEKVLDRNQKKMVLANVNGEAAFGLLLHKVHVILDNVQGTTNGPAALLWDNSIANNIQFIGGNYKSDEAVRSTDEKTIR